jgi:hypothetical protein
LSKRASHASAFETVLIRKGWPTIVGYEAIHMIRKGQAYGSAAGAKVGQVHRFILGLFAATN